MAFFGVLLEGLLPWLKRAGAATLAILPKLMLALLLLLIGYRVINYLARWLEARLESVAIKRRSRSSTIRSYWNKTTGGDLMGTGNNIPDEEAPGEDSSTSHRISPTLMRVSVSFTNWGLKALLILSVASMFGISTTSFIAVITMFSFAVGMALQGFLSDLVAGVMLLIFRPYEVADLVDIANNMGKVSEIGLFETELHTLDNKSVRIPNSMIMFKTITSYSAQGTLSVDVALTISHDANLRDATAVLLDTAAASPLVLQAPIAPEVLLREVNPSGKELIMRAWVRSEDFIPAPFALRMEGTLALEKAGIALAR